MSAIEGFHVALNSPDGTVFPSFHSTELEKGDVELITLLKIRQKCKVSKKYVFSSDGKSSVDDAITLKYYMALMPVETTSLKAGETESKAPTPTVVLKLILAVQTPKPPPPSDFLNNISQLGAGIGGPIAPGTLPSLVMDPLAALSMNFAGTAVSSVHPEPADLTEKQWHQILLNNQALTGYTINRLTGALRKAPKRAFEIKRPMPPVEAANDPLATAYYDSIPGYPSFVINDDAGVTVTEVQTGFQTSLTQQSFSSKTVETSLAASGFGVAASVEAAWQQEDAQTTQAVETSKVDSLHVSYNFPRVTVDLGPETLQLTAECKRDAKNLANEDDVKRFWSKYGQVFSTRVLLGGRLFSSRYLESEERTNMKQTKTKMRVAAGASFGAQNASIGVKSSSTTGQDNMDASTWVNKNLRLTWEARGGETLLCSNPPAWAATVKDYRLWRIMEQSLVVSMESQVKAVDPGMYTNIQYPNPNQTIGTLSDALKLRIRSDVSKGEDEPTTKKIKAFFENPGFTALKAEYDEFAKIPANAPGAEPISATMKWGALSLAQKCAVGYFQAFKGLF